MAKKGKQWGHEEDYSSKGRDVYPSDCKLCYNAININVFVSVPEFESGLISRLSPHILRFLQSVYGIKKG